MIDTVEELTVKKEIAESHIRQVKEIEEQAKLNEECRAWHHYQLYPRIQEWPRGNFQSHDSEQKPLKPCAMKHPWIRFGCFLTGYNYSILRNCSEAAFKSVKKYTAAMLIVCILWFLLVLLLRTVTCPLSLPWLYTGGTSLHRHHCTG